MQMLYNSEHYAVVLFDVPAAEGQAEGLRRGGFEIVDKVSRLEIFLEGAVAERFKAGVEELSAANPGTEAYDEFIAGFASMAQQPVTLH